jgi:hypothetical protein
MIEMCKKLLGLAVALVMLFGVVAIAKAQMEPIKFKYGGWIRYRGVATDNRDRNDDNDDNNSYYDVVFRPSFTATMGSTARVFFQLDIPSFNGIGGDDFHNFGTGVIPTNGARAAHPSGRPDAARTAVNVVVYNLQVQIPGMPGWFVKIGRDNGFMPRGIIADVPTLRSFAVQVWGTAGMFKPRFEMWKRDETTQTGLGNDGLALNDDDDLYVVKMPFSPMKGVRVMPYLAYWRSMNRAYSFGPQEADINMYYPAVSISARQGNFFGKLDFVYQTGEVEHVAGGPADYDAEAYVLWAQVGGSWGPLTASVNYVYASGDRDGADDGEVTRFTGVGCAGTDSGVHCDAYAKGPTDMWFGAKYTDVDIVGSRSLAGNGGASGNGTSTVTIDAAYALTKKLRLQGTVGFISSAEADSRADRVSDKFIGTELDLAATWSIAKGVSLKGGLSYLSAGEYGEMADGSAPNDDSWQAVWKLQWFF